MVKKAGTKRSKDENKVAKSPVKRSPQQKSTQGKRKKRGEKNVDAETEGGSPTDVQDHDHVAEEENGEGDEDSKKPEKSSGKGGRKRKKPVATDTTEETTERKTSKKKVEICTERDPLERIPLPSGGGTGGNKTFTVVSWNVNGLRAIIKNGLATLQQMVETEKPDLVCFQVQYATLRFITATFFFNSERKSET